MAAARARIQYWPGRLPWLVLTLSLALTVLACWYLDVTTNRAESERFARAVEHRERLVTSRLERYLALVSATGAMLADGAPDQAWFRAYVRDLDLESDYRGVKALGWAERVVADAPGGADRWDEVLIEPADPINRKALGFDMASEPARRAAAELARDEGRTVATRRVKLVARPQRAEPAILFVHPVYEGGGVPATVGERRRLLEGFVFAIVHVDELFEVIAVEGGTARVVGSVYDGEPAPENLMRAAPVAPGHEPAWSLRREVAVAGRTWTVLYFSQPEFEEAAPRPVPPVALLGFVVGLTLFGLTRTQERANEAERRHHAALAAADAARREEEERFRSLYDRSPLSTLLFAQDGTPLRSNRASEELWGASWDMVGDYNILRDPMLEQTGVMPLVRDAFAGNPRVLPAIRYVPFSGARAGKPIWLRAHVYPILGGPGSVREVAVVQEDVTDRVLAEEALRDAQRMESVGALATGVAHDFNNLLAIIQGYAGLTADESPPDSAASAYAAQILAASDRAADLTAQLLAYAGKSPFAMNRLDLVAVFSGMYDLVRALLPENIDVVVEGDGGPIPVLADPGQMRLLLTNVANNAREAIGDAPGRFRLAIRRVWLEEPEAKDLRTPWPLAPGEYAEIVVEDDGPGMDEATLRRIFDPFFTTKFLGRGLGLAAVSGIVRRHRGGIVAESAPGRGTRFRILFPIESGEQPAAAPATSAPTVLVAEADEVVRETARDFLEEEGFRVLLAKDGLSASETFREHPEIRLVLLDLVLPGMPGEEAYARIMGMRPGVPVVITSGAAESDALSHLTDRPITAFLPKPWTREALIRAVRRALEGSPAPPRISPEAPPAAP
jgi:PAS domain S-box-containing protein